MHNRLMPSQVIDIVLLFILSSLVVLIHVLLEYIGNNYRLYRVVLDLVVPSAVPNIVPNLWVHSQ